ncbi:MAG TPA: DUF2877 domain-containing protein, partial [Caldilineaceae bacterium]|nr:DUF2877 domain-containing protein [Caldilineaceae bacterium]
LSVHRHVCNLLSSTGQIVALVTPSHDHGPFHIVAPDPALDVMAIGDVAQLDDDRLVLPAGTLDLRAATSWSPRLPEPGHLWLDRALPWLSALARSVVSPLWPSPDQPLSPLQQQAVPAIAALAVGQRSGELPLIASSAGKLAGLGPGLTPAGDDLLVGWLAGLYLQGACEGVAGGNESIGALVAATATARTTRLSTAWLHHAARGEFGAPWHDWATALEQGDGAAIMTTGQRILGRGATSGHDAMLGFLLACGVIETAR